MNDGENATIKHFVHTIVPITDETGANVTRLFVYSEEEEE
jgi:hypothetical protein